MRKTPHLKKRYFRLLENSYEVENNSQCEIKHKKDERSRILYLSENINFYANQALINLRFQNFK